MNVLTERIRTRFSIFVRGQKVSMELAALWQLVSGRQQPYCTLVHKQSVQSCLEMLLTKKV